MKIWPLLLASFLVWAAPGMAATRAAFAYSEGHTLTFANAQGHPLTSLTVRQGISEFAIEPITQRVVIQTAGAIGGLLLWCSVQKRKCTRLMRGPYFFKGDKDSREVYADPAFDPTGRRLVFAIRPLFRDPVAAMTEDAIEATGPLAIMCFPRKRVHILQSTVIKRGGPDLAFPNFPIWSPDGSRILFGEAGGGALTYADGTRLLNIDDAMAGPPLDKEMDMNTPAPLMWLGNNTILFLRAPGDSEADWEKGRVFELNLTNMKVRPVKAVGGIPSFDLQGTVYMQMSEQLLFVKKFDGEEKVYDRQTGRVVWSAQNTSRHPVFAQLVATGNAK